MFQGEGKIHQYELCVKYIYNINNNKSVDMYIMFILLH